LVSPLAMAFASFKLCRRSSYSGFFMLITLFADPSIRHP
jgi:hypothetical protein